MYQKLLSIVTSFILTQVVKDPIRVCNSSSTLIDLIFVSPSVNVNLCSTIPPLLNSDHLGLHLCMSMKCLKKRSKSIVRKIWRYSQADFDRAAKLLDVIEWDQILPDDAESYWTDLKAYFLQVMEMCIPHGMIKAKKNVPWMDNAIGKAIKKRDALFHVAKRSGKLSDRAKYNTQQNKVVSMIRQSKQSFFDKIDLANSNNFWRSVRRLNLQQLSIPILQSNGVSMESSTNKATVLNKYFYNCFNCDFPALQNSDSAYNFEHLIPKDCPDELLCTEDAIFDLLISLDTTKSVGTDGISAKMLKCTATSIASH